jgi:perosamine synthetase
MNEEFPLMQAGEGNIVLFYPHVSERVRQSVFDQLGTRWIGQGPAVERFENEFSKRFCGGLNTAATGSGTDALHLAYLLAGIQRGDEVITPLFTCSATNIPLLYIGAKPVFADVQPDTLNLDPEHVRSLITSKTKAIICVHYGGLPCDMDELQAIANEAGIPIIEDAAHAVGASYKGRSIGSISDFTMFSFQAIKHITTGDGGMLAMKNSWLLPKARRIRWFGIDREAKQQSHWDNDIFEVGYKYQMTDIAASMGLAGLEEWDDTQKQRQRLFAIYEKGLSKISGLSFIGGGYTDRVHAAWLCTVKAENRVGLQHKLREHGIESGQVHYRNDRYSIFQDSRGRFPNMDAVESQYLVLPLHTKMSEEDAQKVVSTINEGW